MKSYSVMEKCLDNMTTILIKGKSVHVKGIKGQRRVKTRFTPRVSRSEKSA